jgi:hypothetical protein
LTHLRKALSGEIENGKPDCERLMREEREEVAIVRIAWALSTAKRGIRYICKYVDYMRDDKIVTEGSVKEFVPAPYGRHGLG